MKKLLLLLLVSPVYAQDKPLTQSVFSIPGAADFLSEALKNAQVVGLLDLQKFVFRKGLAVCLRTLHDSSGTGYLSLSVGADTQGFSEVKPLVLLSADVSRIGDRILFQSAWSKVHITQDMPLPEFWMGPYIRIPFPEDKFQFKNIRDFIGVSFSMKV